jgi:Carboxypeptidase regulatory-like domain
VRDRRFDSVDRICPFRRFVFMKHIVSVAAALVVMALASTGSAQVQTGSILVKATDEQGASTPGVTVTITSGVIVGGSQSGVTDVGGIYRFPALVPGTYTVKLELQGFQTIIRENIQVQVGQTTPIEMAMKVASERGDHGHRRVANCRHDQRQRQRHAQQGTAASDAGRP